MTEIPLELIESLMELGLLESEAKIYVTLAMMNYSEVKNLINFLGLSRPNTYESLRLLEKKGLVTLINPKPMMYQAVPPELGLEILFKTHLKAKEKAEQIFSTLDKQKFTETPQETLWYVFGEKSIEHKIKDMLKNTHKSIFLASSPEYLKYFKNISRMDVQLDITIFTDEKDVEQDLKKIFRDESNYQIISKEDMIKGFASIKSLSKGELKTYYEEAMQTFNYENLMLLIVDNSELLYVLPLSEGALTALNTENKAFMLIIKIAFKNIL